MLSSKTLHFPNSVLFVISGKHPRWQQFCLETKLGVEWFTALVFFQICTVLRVNKSCKNHLRGSFPFFNLCWLILTGNAKLIAFHFVNPSFPNTLDDNSLLPSIWKRKVSYNPVNPISSGMTFILSTPSVFPISSSDRRKHKKRASSTITDPSFLPQSLNVHDSTSRILVPGKTRHPKE